MSKQKTPNWVKSIISLLALFSGSALISANVNVEIHKTPEAERMGWVAPEVPPEDVEEFRIVGTPPGWTSEGKTVKLWEYAKDINGGEHFPTFRQEIGDCVANGAANAINYLQAVQIASDSTPLWEVGDSIDIRGPPEEVVEDFKPIEFKPASRMFIYGVSRTDPELGNKRLRGDGSTGYWAAYGCRDVGVVSTLENGVPPYSGATCRKWGKTGPPKPLIETAKDFRVREVALVKTYTEARDAITNGYPVTIASNQGFEMTAVVDGGKSWGRPRGNWNHQMCLIGVDDKAQGPFGGPRGAVYCLNSWGEKAHGEPADDAPPGGFWIDRKTIEKILSQKDSWCYSNFDGFPLRDLDFQVFGSKGPVELAEFNEVQNDHVTLAGSVGLDPKKVNQSGYFGLMLFASGILAVYGTRRWNSIKTKTGSVA